MPDTSAVAKELLMNPFRKFLMLVALVVTSVHFLASQWVQTSGPYGGTIQALAADATNLFAGTDGGGVFHSTNNGGSWTSARNGLTDPHVLSLAMSDTNLFVGTAYGGVFLSTNNGASWT